MSTIAGTGGPKQPANDWKRDEQTVAWVYSGMLTGVAVVVASTTIATRPWQVTVYTAIATVVLWMAHSYAAFVGHGGRFEGGQVRGRIRQAVAVESTILLAGGPAIITTVIAALLGAGVSGVGYAGTAAAVATMVVAAGVAARRSGAGPIGVSIGALGALLIGGFLIAAKVGLK